MHRLIGEAYISLLADAARFRPDADAKLKSALSGMRAKIPLDADAGPAEKKIAALAAALKGLHGDAKINTSSAIRDIATLKTALIALRKDATNIPLDFNDSKTLAKLYAVLGTVDDLREKAANVDGNGDVTKLLAKFYSVRSVVEGLQTAASHINANGDISEMLGKLDILKTDTERLSEMLAHMRADTDDKAFLTKIVSLQATVLKFAKTLRDMPVTADALPMEADLLKLWSMAEALQHKLSAMKIGASGVSVQPNVLAPGRNMSPVGVNPADLRFMSELASQSLAAMTDVDKLNKSLDSTGPVAAIAAAGLAKMAAGQSMVISKGTGWGAWNNQIRLFGGALDSVLPKWAKAISLWHLGADVIFEFAAAWAPALIAVATFAAYAYPVGQKIYGQWKNINTILDGVGGRLPDLGRSFDIIQRAIEPSVLIAFGEYMGVIGHNASALGSALTKVGQVVDVWGAKMVAWAASAQKGFNNIVGSGAKDLAMIGEGFHQVFRILGTLFHDMPGYVHILLAVGVGFLTLTANVVKFLSPLLKAGLYLHGFIVYVGLAVTAVLALGRAIAASAIYTFLAKTGAASSAVGVAAEGAAGKFNRFGSAIGTFAGSLAAGAANTFNYSKGLFSVGNEAEKVGLKARIGAAGGKLLKDALGLIPFGTVGLAAAGAAIAIGVILYFALRHSTDAADKFAKAMQSLVAGSTAANIQKNLQSALAQTTAQFSKANTAAQQNSHFLQNVQQNMQHASGASMAGAHDFGVYRAALDSARTSAETYNARLNQLTKVFGSAGAAQAAMSLAGIKAGDVATENNQKWAIQLTELQSLARGYGYMGQQAGAAGAQLNTLNIASGNTTKNVQALQQAESGFITMVTSGDTAFTAFEQGQQTLNSTMKQGAKSGSTLTVTVGKLREQYALTGTKMNGTSASALAARQAFDQQVSAGVTLYGNLQMLATAGGNTASAQRSLAKSGKDIIAQLLPMAAGSKQATAEVYALAQIVGYTGKDSFPALARWLGRTKGAEGDLNSQQAKLTIGMARTSTAAKNLGNALNTTLATGEANAIAKSFGLDSAINNLAIVASRTGSKVSRAAVTFSGEYVAALKKSGESTNQAKQQLNSYLARLGYTPSAIAAIDAQLGGSLPQWNKYARAVQQNTRAAQANQKALKDNYAAFANLESILPGSSTQLDKVWQSLVRQDAAMVASGKGAQGARKQFADFAVNGLQVTRTQADALWAKFGNQNLDSIASKAANTKSKFIDFAQNGLHLTSQQAHTLWGEFALQNLDMLVAKGNNAKSKFIELARNGLDLTASQATNLWNTLKNQYLDTLAGKAGETRTAFEKTAGSLGLTKQKADDLWGSLHKLSSGSPYNASETTTFSGSGSVTAKANIPGQPALTSHLNFLPHAAGGVIRGGIHGKDSVPTMLAPGELVIPSTHAAIFHADAKRAGIPGMAAGGVVNGASGGGSKSSGGGSKSSGGGSSTPAGTFSNSPVGGGKLGNMVSGINNDVPFGVGNTTQFYKATATAFSKSLLASVKNQLQVAGGAYNGPSGFGGGFDSMAALVAYARYFMANGMNRAAAAGMAGTISGEQNASGPESRGSGGWGLIGWTGNTVGLPPGYHGPTGNVAFDLAQQLKGVIGYMNARGGPGPLNAAGNPVAAGDVWSRYEAPAVALSDTRPGTANAIYAALGGGSPGAIQQAVRTQKRVAGKTGQVRPHSGGGVISEPVLGTGQWSGIPYSFAENGQPEIVANAGQVKAPGHAGMPSQTIFQGTTLIQQNNMIIKLLQQMPYAYARAQATGAGKGVSHGYFGAQN